MKNMKRFNPRYLLICGMLCVASIFALFAGKVSAAGLVAEAGPNQEVEINQTVNFDGSVSIGAIVSHSWDLGDGSTASAVNPIHSYISVGTYTVTLTVSDGLGGTSTDTVTITVENLERPSAPANLEGFGGNNTSALRWDDNTEPDVIGYNVYRSLTSGGPYNKINTSILTNNSYSDTGVVNGTSYFYVITAVDASFNESLTSIEKEVIPNYAGPTNVGGAITSNTTWSLSGSPYIVTDNITVNSGITLTIEPGTIVKFDNGYGLDIQDAIQVAGTPSNPITFTSNAVSPQKNDWEAITCTEYAGKSFVMDWCVIEYATGGIQFSTQSSSIVTASITNSIIRYTGDVGIVVVDYISAGITLTVSNNQVYEVDGLGIAYAGLGSYESSIEITNNTINNTVYGIYFQNNHCQAWSGVIANNNVYSNSVGIFVTNTDSGSISGLLHITNNEVYNGFSGIYLRSNNTAMNFVVNYNEVYNNADRGIDVDVPYSTQFDQIQLKLNNIYDNTNYAVYNSNSSIIGARLNWWGDASGPSGLGAGIGGAINSSVEYNPWLGQTFSQPFHISDALAVPIKFNQNSGTTFTVSFTEEANWSLTVLDTMDLAVRNFSGIGNAIDQDWNGDDNSSNPLADGIYTYNIQATSNGSSLVAAPVIGILEFDGTIPIANITSPNQNEIIAQESTVSIIGTADDSNISSYEVQYGVGESPASWVNINSGSSPVINGTLASWDTSSLTNDCYTLKLTVTDASSNAATDSVTIKLFFVSNISDSPDPFSPNSDGINDVTTISALFSLPGDWILTIKDSSDTTVKTFSGSGSSISQVWDGTDSSLSVVPDDTYTYRIEATETSSGSPLTPATGSIQVDNTVPTSEITSPTADDIITDNNALEIVGTAFDSNISSYLVE